MIPLCVICGKRPVAQSLHKTPTGKVRLRKRCDQCIKESRSVRLNGHRDHVLSYKKSYCEECGFVAKHPAQLDVDHIDGNRFNADPSNFRTLCANCHRLKTATNRDNVKWVAGSTKPVQEPSLFND